MSDLNQALTDIDTIRRQIARQANHLRLGPAMLATTALLALAMGFIQARWLSDPTAHPVEYFGPWIMLAVVCVGLIGLGIWRSAGVGHRGMSLAMIEQAVEAFMPAGMTGCFLALVFARFTPDQVWMLPGLWQILVGLGVFAALRILPRATILIGGWYLIAGFATLTIASEAHSLSPALMALPFALGQAGLAVIMHRHTGAAR